MTNSSINYIRSRIEEGNCLNMDPKEFTNLYSIPFKTFFREDSPEDMIFAIREDKEEPFGFLHYRPSANFNYFITESFHCDGTLLFTHEACINILRKIANFDTCYSPAIEEVDFEEEGVTVHYEVGDFVINNIMVEKSPDPERPWLREKVTVMLPVRFYICK